MYYYEIKFNADNEENSYSWYIENTAKLTNKQMINMIKMLKDDILANGILEKDIDNIISIQEINKKEYILGCEN